MILFSYILLVLHPRHKLRYFKNAGWTDEWVDEAETILRTEFDKSYGSVDASWAAQSKSKVCNFELLFIIIKVLYYFL